MLLVICKKDKLLQTEENRLSMNNNINNRSKKIVRKIQRHRTRIKWCLLNKISKVDLIRDRLLIIVIRSSKVHRLHQQNSSNLLISCNNSNKSSKFLMYKAIERFITSLRRFKEISIKVQKVLKIRIWVLLKVTLVILQK